MTVSLKECTVSELNPKMKQTLQQYVTRDDKVLICYEASEPGVISAYLLTDRLIASVIIRMKGLFGRLFGDPSIPDQDTRMLFLRDIASVQYGEVGRGYHFPYYITVHGHDPNWGVGFHFRSRNAFYQRVATTLQEAVEQAKQLSSRRDTDITDRLQQLTKLHNEGLITDEEFRQKREKLLKSL